MMVQVEEHLRKEHAKMASELIEYAEKVTITRQGRIFIMVLLFL